jgi:hypothetical protein
VIRESSDVEMLKGTLDMMILRTLVAGDAHGHTIAKVIERTSEDFLEVEQGSLYPALHRLEDRGGKWGGKWGKWGEMGDSLICVIFRPVREGWDELAPVLSPQE